MVFLIVIHAGLIIWASTLAISFLYRVDLSSESVKVSKTGASLLCCLSLSPRRIVLGKKRHFASQGEVELTFSLLSIRRSMTLWRYSENVIWIHRFGWMAPMTDRYARLTYASEVVQARKFHPLKDFPPHKNRDKNQIRNSDFSSLVLQGWNHEGGRSFGVRDLQRRSVHSEELTSL